MLQKEAGCRMLPPVSDPRANRHSPAETAAAGPPLLPPGNAVQAPRVVGREKGGVLGGRAHGELIHIPFPQEDRPLPVQPLRHRGAIGRNKVFKHAGGAGGLDPLGSHIVFQLHGDAGQRPGLSRGDPLIGRFCLLEGYLLRYRGVGLDALLSLADPLQNVMGQLYRRELFALQEVMGLVDCQVVMVAHGRAKGGLVF